MCAKQNRFDIEALKQAAAGRWLEILTELGGVGPELLDGRPHPCPKCGGTDRFRMIDGDAGALFCNQCFSEKNGDGIAALQWLLGVDFQTALNMLADHLGMALGNGRHAVPVDPLEAIARQKGISAESLKAFGAKAVDGAVVVPMFGPDGQQCSSMTLKPDGGKGLYCQGRPVGLFLPGQTPKSGETWHGVEGVKDASALHSLGLNSFGLPGSAMNGRFGRLLHGVDVVLIPDRDRAGVDGAEKTSAVLFGVARSIRVAVLPAAFKESKGADVRDVLNMKDGESLLRQAIEDAQPVGPSPTDDWAEIIPVDSWDPPAMSIEGFPSPLRDWITEEAHATQTPVEMAAMLAIAVCATAIAKRVEVEARIGWIEPTNLFVAAIAEPGERKSAVFSDAVKPLLNIESELAEHAEPLVARDLSERRQDETSLKTAEKKAAKTGTKEDRRAASDLAADMAQREPLALPRIVVDDVTAERLAAILGEQEGRLASMSPEGGVFDLMAGKYSKNGGTSFEVYLKSHAGDNLVIDRVSRASVRVERPALTCAYAMQPEVIRGVSGNPAFRGRGLLGRFLFVCPTSRVGSREIAPTPMSGETRGAYHDMVRRLYRDASRWGGGDRSDRSDGGDAHSFGEFDAFDDEPDRFSGEAFVLRLDRDASLRFIAWETEVEPMLADGGRMDHMRDWGNKLVGATLRLAAVLHCVEFGVRGRIGLQTMEVAVGVAHVLLVHADYTLNLMAAGSGTTDSDAAHLLRWIDRQGRKSFSKRDAQQGNKSRFPMAEDINDPLRELVERGYIRSPPAGPPQRGRPASPLFDVNPHHWEI